MKALKFVGARGIHACIHVAGLSGALAMSPIQSPSGLVDWWPANGNPIDIIGAKNGSLRSGASFVTGKVGGGFAFDGTTNGIVTTSGAAMTNIQNTFTVEFWAYPTAARNSATESTSGTAGLASQRYAIMPSHGGFVTQGPAGVGVSVGSNGVSVVELADNYMPCVLVYSSSLTTWTHVAVVYQSHQPKLYINGVLVRTGLTSQRAFVYPSKQFGGDGVTAVSYKGWLDEVSIYNRALSQSELASIYAAGSAGKGQPPNNLAIQPQNCTVAPGETVSFTVTGAGELPFQYQWLKANDPFPQATNATLVLEQVALRDQGYYSVVVSNAFGVATSPQVPLGVASPLDIGWVHQLSGTGDDSTSAILTDCAGSVFAIGTFFGNVDLVGAGYFSSNSADIFIAKYSNAGQLLWATKDGGTTNGLPLAVNAQLNGNGDILVTGAFSGMARFGAVRLNTTGPLGSAFDMFLARYNGNGDLCWVARSNAGTNKVVGEALTIDYAGNVTVAGIFGGSVKFGDTQLTSLADKSSFLARFDASGNLLWATCMTGTNAVVSTGVGSDAAGNVFLCGVFSGTADFGGTRLTARERDVFLGKYSPAGKLQWVKNFGGTSFDEPHAMAVDLAGNCYVTGMFFSTDADFGGAILKNSGSADIFLCKYDSSGNLLWARQAGGSGYDNPAGLVLGSDGTVYLAAHFGASAYFGANLLVSAGGQDAVVARYDSNGSCLWAKSWGGPLTSIYSVPSTIPVRAPAWLWIALATCSPSRDSVPLPQLEPLIL